MPAELILLTAGGIVALGVILIARRPSRPAGLGLAPADSPHAAQDMDVFQRLLLRLAAASTPNQVADVLFTDGRAMFAADVAGLATRTPDGRAVHVVGWSRDWTAASSEIQLDRAGIVAEVVLLSNPAWGRTRADEARGTVNPFAQRAGDMASFAIVPLRAHNVTIGALSLAWKDVRTLRADERGLLESMGRHFGAAVERAMRYETEQRLRQEAETTRREALRLRDELSAVLKSIPEPVFVVARDGAITLRNASASELVEGVATLADLRSRFPPLDTDPGGGTPARPLVRSTSGGRVFEFGEYATDRSDSRIIMLRDVTDERRAQEARDAFIGVLSHELRTPVTTILGGIDLVVRGLDPERTRELLADVKFEAERLRRLIDDLLILSRFERHALEVGSEPVLAQRLLPRIVKIEASRHTPAARIRLDVPQNVPPVDADPTYLDQVLRNLIGNAVKYGADSGPIDVSVEPIDGIVQITVRDQGPGFPNEDAERLFDLFYRSSGTASKPGAGIGLFAARQLALSMRGDLVARRREPKGAEFVLTLPVVDPDSARHAGERPE